jgi:hypothetical protein
VMDGEEERKFNLRGEPLKDEGEAEGTTDV